MTDIINKIIKECRKKFKTYEGIESEFEKQHLSRLFEDFLTLSLEKAIQEAREKTIKEAKEILRGEGEKGNAGEMISVNYLEELLDTLSLPEKEGLNL